MKLFKLLLFATAILFAGCDAQQRVLYLQGLESGSVVDLPAQAESRLLWRRTLVGSHAPKDRRAAVHRRL